MFLNASTLEHFSMRDSDLQCTLSNVSTCHSSTSYWLNSKNTHVSQNFEFSLSLVGTIMFVWDTSLPSMSFESIYCRCFLANIGCKKPTQTLLCGVPTPKGEINVPHNHISIVSPETPVIWAWRELFFPCAEHLLERKLLRSQNFELEYFE